LFKGNIPVQLILAVLGQELNLTHKQLTIKAEKEGVNSRFWLGVMQRSHYALDLWVN
jgi:hypothetical protein